MQKNVHTSVKTRGMGMCFRDSKLFRYIDSHTNTRNQPHRNVEAKMVVVRGWEKVALPSSRYILKEDVHFPFLKSSS